MDTAIAANTDTPHRLSSMHHDPASAQRALVEMELAHKAEHREVARRREHLYAAGRMLLASIFLVSGIAKVTGYGETLRALDDRGLADATMLLPIAVLCELAGGLLLATGLVTRAAAFGLVAYLGAVTLLVHGDPTVDLNRAFALANLALAGGLLTVAAHGGGAFSLDRLLEHRRRNRECATARPA